ncbi:DsrE family protein [Pontiella sp.]|uniref:DsrE family protein n=1 Tax=Pontiella sp. TaxID=2837462 RepID=UPI00356276FD
MGTKTVYLALVGLLVSCGVVSAKPPEAPSRLCVVWTSADPDVAKNVCFMYALNAKKAGWFDEVCLVVWGPSAKLLAEDPALQAELKAMQQVGVVTEACVACARRYGVVDDLKKLDLDVKGMGQPLSDRLKADWKVITF